MLGSSIVRVDPVLLLHTPLLAKGCLWLRIFSPTRSCIHPLPAGGNCCAQTLLLLEFSASQCDLLMSCIGLLHCGVWTPTFQVFALPVCTHTHPASVHTHMPCLCVHSHALPLCTLTCPSFVHTPMCCLCANSHVLPLSTLPCAASVHTHMSFFCPHSHALPLCILIHPASVHAHISSLPFF